MVEDFFQLPFLKRKKQPIKWEYAAANPDDPEVVEWLQKMDNSTVMDRMLAKRIRELQVANQIDKQNKPKRLYPFVGVK